MHLVEKQKLSIIRKLTKSEYSHCCVSITHDDSWIIEADVFQRIKPRKNKYKSEEFRIVDIGLSDEQRLKLLLYLIKQTDKRYDYMQIAGLFLRLLGLSSRENLWNSRNRIICSELVDRGYKEALGIDLVPPLKDGDVTPADLASVLLREPIIKTP